PCGPAASAIQTCSRIDAPCSPSGHVACAPSCPSGSVARPVSTHVGAGTSSPPLNGRLTADSPTTSAAAAEGLAFARWIEKAWPGCSTPLPDSEGRPLIPDVAPPSIVQYGVNANSV